MTDLRDASDVRDEPGETSLAGLWSSTLQSIAGRVAHELNNALNGALMNVAVVQSRARPGADAGASAPFAEAAAAQLDETATLVAALLALARAPRGAADAGELLHQATALLAPALAHDGVRLDATGARRTPVGGDPTATRLAICAALLVVGDAARTARGTVETAGPEPANDAGEPVCLVRCMTLTGERPTAVIAPRYDAMLAPTVARVVAGAGIVVSLDADALRLAFPPPASPY